MNVYKSSSYKIVSNDLTSKYEYESGTFVMI